MKRIFLAPLLLWPLMAQAQDVTNPSPPNSINGAYNASAPTCTDGHGCWVQTDINGKLIITGSVTPTAPVGSSSLSVTQVSIATTDTLAIAARTGRQAVTIQQITGTQNVFCNQTTATAANGVVLPAVVGASITLNTTSAVRCIAITGAQTVAIAETF